MASKLSLFAFEGYALALLGLGCAQLAKFDAAAIACRRSMAIAESNQLGEFHLEAIGVLLDAAALFDDDLHARLKQRAARAIAEAEAAISSPDACEAFRKRRLIRNLLGKTVPSAVQSQGEALPSPPSG
jgi:hypothetical protein